MERVERLLGAVAAVVLLPQPLRVGGEALVQPHVPPGLRADGVPVPLVGELVDEQYRAGGTGEVGAVLGLQGVPGVLGAVDDRAGGGEGVRAEVLLRPVDDLGDPRQGRPARVGQLRVDGRVDRQTAGGAGAVGLPLADRDRDHVARHRLGGVPGERRTAVAGPFAPQLAVGDRAEPLRHGHREVVRRFVGRVVTAREPGHRARRLTQPDRAVGGVQPALFGAVGVSDRHRFARVADSHPERPAGVQLAGRADRQFLPRAVGAGAPAADRDVLDVQALEVQVEGRQVTGGARRDRRRAGEVARARVVVELQVVVADVVTAVARLGEVRVARTRAAGAALNRAPATARREGGEGGGRCERAGGTHIVILWGVSRETPFGAGRGEAGRGGVRAGRPPGGGRACRRPPGRTSGRPSNGVELPGERQTFTPKSWAMPTRPEA